MSRKAAFHNLGCKVNSYEMDVMLQELKNKGYEIVPFEEKADIYIVNTCTVTNIADRKSRQMLHRAKKLNPESVVVAAGCYVQTSTEQAKADAAIDIIIGNNKKQDLLNMLAAYEADHGAEQEGVLDINHTKQEYEELTVIHPSEHTRAFLKVQDGCNQFCSYCIIPYARGRVRSRKLEDVEQEARRLAENGFQELVLTGIHLSSYGIDIEDDLLHLIEQVHEIKGIQRIRLGSLEPKIVTEEFAKRLSELEKICPHFHLSLQSGCDATLERMNRKYTTEEYAKSCGYLRKYFREPAITTDVIVGFPGETEEEFAVTKQYLEKIHFYEMHIFKYSKRQGTKAAKMSDQIDEQIKTKRSNELLALEKKMSKEFRDAHIGKEDEALLEEQVQIDGVDYYVGFTKEYVKIAVRSEKDLSNCMVRGRIEGALNENVYLMTAYS